MDVAAPLDDLSAVRTSVRTNPIAAWTGRRARNGNPFFAFDGAVFETTFNVEPGLRTAFNGMVARNLFD